MVRLIGVATLVTNSSQASSSAETAHKQTMSLRDRDEYRVEAVLFHIQNFSRLGIRDPGSLFVVTKTAGKRRQVSSTFAATFEHSAVASTSEDDETARDTPIRVNFSAELGHFHEEYLLRYPVNAL
jgi:hypothetical protein